MFERRTAKPWFVAFTLLLATFDSAHAQHEDILVYSTSSGGGSLVGQPAPGVNPVYRNEALCFETACLFSTTDPGVQTPSSPDGALFPVAEGTEVSLEVVALDAAVNVNVGSATLDGVGQSVVLGTASSLHIHPVFQIVVPEDEVGQYAFSFRFTAAGYDPSPAYDMLLSNGPEPTATPTATPTPVPTETPAPTMVPAQPTVGPLPEIVRSEPRGRGDQLVFYYDTREGFTSFLNVANPGGSAVDVELSFYDSALVARYASTETIPAGGTRTIDVGGLVGSGLTRSAGIATITAIDGAGLPVTTGMLGGNFTVANLQTQSAWGGPAAGRRAWRRDGGGFVPAGPGQRIDGDVVVLEPLSPEALDLATYYDPATLEPADRGGNQLIFVSFADVVGGAGIAAQPSTWNVSASRNDGTLLPSVTWMAEGVEVSNLVAVAGAGIEGAAGRLEFVAAPGSAANRMVFFLESLDTFATGYRLPALPESSREASSGSKQVPHARGDQLVMFFDASAGATSFLNIGNEGDVALDVLVRLYSADFGVFVDNTETIPARGTRTVDVGSFLSTGLPAGPGVALAVAVDSAGQPVVSQALAGNLTIANLGTLSAWGAPAAARAAVRSADGASADVGERVDGRNIFFEPLRPATADLSVYYDPSTLEPAELGGNRVILVSFDDLPANPLAAAAGEVTWRFDGTRSDGSPTSEGAHSSSGVDATDLEALVGSEVLGSAGSLHLWVDPDSQSNRFAYFVESLDTFATGYSLPTSE